MSQEVRAIVLAAGFGQRLRPLTETLPKPLLPLHGHSILSHTLRSLSKAGIRRVGINLHHCPEQIPRALKTDHDLDLDLEYSNETTLRGTLGALDAFSGFIAGADALVVVNGDTLCHWPLKRLLTRHKKSSSVATLLLLARENAAYGGGVALDSRGQVVGFRNLRTTASVDRRRVYAGLQILDPRLLPTIRPGETNFVEDLWQPWLHQGKKISVYETKKKWHDLGTPERYLNGALNYLPWWRRGWTSPDLSGPRRSWKRAVVESGVTWETKTTLKHSLVLPGAHLGKGCHLERVVVGPGTQIPPGTRISNRLISRVRTGIEPPPGTLRLGDLWVGPLTPKRPSS